MRDRILTTIYAAIFAAVIICSAQAAVIAARFVAGAN